MQVAFPNSMGKATNPLTRKYDIPRAFLGGGFERKRFRIRAAQGSTAPRLLLAVGGQLRNVRFTKARLLGCSRSALRAAGPPGPARRRE